MKNEMVPLTERLRYLQAFRVAVAFLFLGVATFAPDQLDAPLGDVVSSAAVYLGASLVAEFIWRLARGRGLLLFGAMIIVDGFYLAWMSYLTGGTLSPFRFVILVHLIIVTLMASYRTGVKLAFWHSLLLFIVFHAEEAGILEPVENAYGSVAGTPYGRITGFIVALWVVALATASFSALNERELRRRKLDVESLAHLAEELATAKDPQGIADSLVEGLNAAFGFRRIALFAAATGDPVLFGGTGLEKRVLPPGTDEVVQQAMESGEIDLLQTIAPGPNPRLSSLLPEPANLVVIPLKAEGTSLGVVVAEHSFRSRSRIEERIVAMAQQFASQAALALSNAWLLERMRSMAVTDALTGVYNRGHLQKVLPQQLNRATRAGEELSLVMLDIDHFKAINDTHGHQVGDVVLQTIAAELTRQCRDFDTVARYGGEEFAIILPTTQEKVAITVAERLRRAIEGCPTPVPVTASLGVAVFPSHGITAEELTRVADAALYASKRAGRNRVTLAVGAGEPRAKSPTPPVPAG